MDSLSYVAEKLSKDARLTSVIEEAAELQKACCKLLRQDNGNWTPVTREEAEENFREEVADLLITLHSLKLNLEEIENDYSFKIDRWAKRIQEH